MTNKQVISELRGIIWQMGSHSITCHLAQVNRLRLNPETGWYSINLPGGMEG